MSTGIDKKVKFRLSVPAGRQNLTFFYMSFTPTKIQLEELGFKYGNVRCQLQIDKPPFDIWLSYGWGFFIQIGDENRKIYPQSIDDLKTLLRLLSPNN